jgi:hypothetical protein
VDDTPDVGKADQHCFDLVLLTSVVLWPGDSPWTVFNISNVSLGRFLQFNIKFHIHSLFYRTRHFHVWTNLTTPSDRCHIARREIKKNEPRTLFARPCTTWRFKLAFTVTQPVSVPSSSQPRNLRNISEAFVKKFAKLCLFTSSVCSHVRTRKPLDEYSWNLVLGSSTKICRCIPGLIKIGEQKLSLCICRSTCVPVRIFNRNKLNIYETEK